MRRTRFFLTVFFCFLLTAANVKAEVSLPHVFSDNMVLQQNSKCPVFGFASPGEKIEITASWGKTATATANSAGRWMTNIQTPEYGGPYTLEIQGVNKITIKNVLIGEVWFAGGEGNMELPLAGYGVKDTVLGGYNIWSGIKTDKIRILNVPESFSYTLKENFENEISWEVASRNNASRISAVAYCFANKIYNETGIPVGIISVCSTGSLCESWVAKEYLKRIPEFHDRMAEYEKYVPLQANFVSWVESHPTIKPTENGENYFNPSEFHDTECAKISFSDAQWGVMRLPSYLDETEGLSNFDGTVWLRRWVDIPDEWAGKKLILSLGPVDDFDETFVNGVKVGSTMKLGYWNKGRIYTIDPSLVKAGEMLIAIRVIDNAYRGGIYGRASDMKIYPEGNEDDALYIAGDWKFLPTGEIRNYLLYVYGYENQEFFTRPKLDIKVSNKTIAGVYNGMINPLLPYKIAGVIWYQGESNVGNPSEYTKTLIQLAHCLRDGFKSSDMKFYFAQIAPYEYGKGVNSAGLREAQRRAAAEIPNSGMACLLDIGRKESFYSAYKREAGERLARFALNDLYGKQYETSGPVFKSMSVDKEKIILTFDNVAGGLTVRGAKLSDFEISDLKGVYYPAEAEITGTNKITVYSSKVEIPKNVRYCWKNYYKEVSLYNDAGLPASSFTTEKKIQR